MDALSFSRSNALSSLAMDGPPFTSMEDLDQLINSPWSETPQNKIPTDWRTVAPNGCWYDIDTYIPPDPSRFRKGSKRKPRKQSIGWSARNADWMRGRLEL